MQDQLLSIHAVKERVPMDKTKIYSLIKEEKFPRPYCPPSLGKSVSWRASGIQAFIGAVASGAEWKDNDKQRAALLSPSICSVSKNVSNEVAVQRCHSANKRL